jgi:hypothetical protein
MGARHGHSNSLSEETRVEGGYQILGACTNSALSSPFSGSRFADQTTLRPHSYSRTSRLAEHLIIDRVERLVGGPFALWIVPLTRTLEGDNAQLGPE